MREIRKSGSEGGAGQNNVPFLPLSLAFASHTLSSHFRMSEAKKIKRGVYDGRVSEVISIEDVAPVDHVRWGTVNDREGWTVSVCAPRDEQVALPLLAKALSEYSLDAYEKWVLAGKPIAVDDLSSSPNLFPVDLTPL